MTSTSPETAPSPIDDRDPRVNYFGQWFNVETTNKAVSGGTLSSTSDTNAGFEFAFTGIQISVFGTVFNNGSGSVPPIVRFTIDNDPPIVFNGPPLTVEGDGLLLFQSGQLSPGSHQLIANTTRASAKSPFYVDYLTVLPIGATFPTSSSPSTDSPASPSSNPTDTTTSGLAAPSGGTPDDTQGSVQGKSSNAGPIAGGVIGGVVIIALILLGVWFWRRRRNGLVSYPGDAGITPAMRDTGTPVVAAAAGRDHEEGRGSGRVTPYLLSTEYTGSQSGPMEGGSTFGRRFPGSKIMSPTTTTSYFVNSEAAASVPLLESSGSDSSSNVGGHAVVAAAASAPALASPPITGSTDALPSEKQPIPPDPEPSSSVPQRPRALPTPQHNDSGARFPPRAPPEVALVSAIGAPPAYTAD